MIFALENLFTIPSNEIKLAILVIVNIAVFISMIVFMPSSIKGDTFDWLIEKYERYIPSMFLRFYFAFNNPPVKIKSKISKSSGVTKED